MLTLKGRSLFMCEKKHTHIKSTLIQLCKTIRCEKVEEGAQQMFGTITDKQKTYFCFIKLF